MLQLFVSLYHDPVKAGNEIGIDFSVTPGALEEDKACFKRGHLGHKMDPLSCLT